MTTLPLPGVGDRIRLIEMLNDPCPIEPGSLGTVTYVSSGPQQIGVKWDSGRTLMLVAGADKFEIVTPHRVVLIEDNAYARYDVFVEATDPDQAAGIAREMVVNGKADSGSQHFRDDALPYVTDVIDAAGEECWFSEEHAFDGVTVPDLLKARDTCADVIETIDDFSVACEQAQHTDTGLVWETLNQIRTKLFEALPKHMQDQATAYLHELTWSAEREETPSPSGLRVFATFRPQAWQNDQAIYVDADGETRFDVTYELLLLGREVALDLHKRHEERDNLRMAIEAPAWIKNWSGPFEIEIDEDEVATLFAAKTAEAA